MPVVEWLPAGVFKRRSGDGDGRTWKRRRLLRCNYVYLQNDVSSSIRVDVAYVVYNFTAEHAERPWRRDAATILAPTI